MINGNFTENAKTCMVKLEGIFGHDSIVAALQPSKYDLLVVIKENTFGDGTSFVLSLLHSNDEFQTDKQDCLCNDWQSGKEVCNRIGLIAFTTYKSKDFAWLNLIEVDEKFYGQGYGSMMMKYLKLILQNNPAVNLGKRCNQIAGHFKPHGPRSAEDVKRFYLRNGCNSNKLNSFGYIEIPSKEKAVGSGKS